MRNAIRIVSIAALLLSAVALTGCPPKPKQIDVTTRYTVVWSNGYQYMSVDADDVRVRSDEIVLVPKVVRQAPRGVEPGVEVSISKDTLVVDRRSRTEADR